MSHQDVDKNLLLRISRTICQSLHDVYNTIALYYKNKGLRHVIKTVILNPKRCFRHVIRGFVPLPIILPINKNFFKKMIIFAGVPLGDAGGGQRSSQLARCAVLSGIEVTYIFLYQSYDFAKKCYVTPAFNIPNIRELHLDAVTPLGIIDLIDDKDTIALFELPHPKLLPYLKELNKHSVTTIYELIDDWDSSLGADWFSHATHQQFITHSRRIVATAQFLFEKIKTMGREDVELLPNAANELIFDKYGMIDKFNRPAKYMPGRAIGVYVGSLYGEWFSWDYVIESALKNPSIDFMIIGSYNDKPRLPNNVKLLGKIDITVLSPFIAYATFAFIPFLPSKITDATSPIKVFEYLFVGKPVISTRIRDIVGYPGVHIADSKEEFAQLCAQVINNKLDQSSNDLFISRNSWFSRLDKLLGMPALEQEMSAVILCYNNKNIIARLINSLMEHCSNLFKDIIIVDNQSTDGSYEYIKKHFPHVTLLMNQVNGCSSGRNLGVKAARGEYLVFLDSDQWLTSRLGFIKACHLLKTNDSLGAIGWAAGWFVDPTFKSLGSSNLSTRLDCGINEQHYAWGYRDDIHYLGSGGLFMRKDDFDAIGGFDEYYDPTCFEDTDISFKIKSYGKKIVYSRLPGIMHEPHQTTHAGSKRDNYQALFKRNELYFRSKWFDELNALSMKSLY